MEQAVIAIFASGAGSNAQKVIQHFRNHPSIKVKLVCSNKNTAKVIQVAKDLDIETFIFSREEFYQSTIVIEELTKRGVTHIVLAGFLWLIPQELIREYSNRIINIHPSLLPKFGGRGMYGNYVHQAVKESGEKETGITIHLVNEQYDKGEILLQEKTPLSGSESIEEIAEKVQKLEHTFFPSAIERWIQS